MSGEKEIKEAKIGKIIVKYRKQYSSDLWLIFVILCLFKVINTQYDWLLFFGVCILDSILEAIVKGSEK